MALFRPGRRFDTIVLMNTPSIAAIALALTMGFAPVPGIAQTGPDGLTERQVTRFLDALQEAVRSGEAKEVAKLMAFPIAVTTPTANTRIADGNSFLQNYKLIFTDSVRAAVVAQKPDTLFRNAKGVMIGDGEVWFAGVCVDTKCSSSRVGVIAVNALPPKKK